MSAEEFAALVVDIREHGLREAIWLDGDGKIIDGRHRQRACDELGIQAAYRTWRGEGSVLAFVLSLNLHRRHLTASQRAACAIDALPIYEAEARERQKVAGGDRKSETYRGGAESLGAGLPQPLRAAKSSENAAAGFGVSARYVSDAKRVSEARPDLLEQVKEGTVTLARAVTEVKREERQRAIPPAPTLADVTGPFAVLYADPPWRYDYAPAESRAIENQYPTLSVEDICALPVEALAAEDAVLYLWATSPKLVEALQVMAAWGFAYRTCAVWDKGVIGMGYYFRQQHEILLVGTRGHLPAPAPENRPSSVINAPRGVHSEKPAKVAELLEAMYPGLPKVELFCRTARPGWATWGTHERTP